MPLPMTYVQGEEKSESSCTDEWPEWMCRRTSSCHTAWWSGCDCFYRQGPVWWSTTAVTSATVSAVAQHRHHGKTKVLFQHGSYNLQGVLINYLDLGTSKWNKLGAVKKVSLFCYTTLVIDKLTVKRSLSGRYCVISVGFFFSCDL